LRGRGADGDAVRAQPDGGVAFAGRVRRARRLPHRGRGADRGAEGSGLMTEYWCEHALLPSGVESSVLVSVADGRFASVTAAAGPGAAERLTGLTIPGLANCHSHAFHRALRGRTQRERGTFWTWREQMYAVAARLTPDSYYALARAAYGEMALSGITCVGEFHYLHHGPDGTPYAAPNAMGDALVAAARDAGLRIALLDTCYLAGGIDQELTGVQGGFGDGDADPAAARGAR